MKPKKFDESTKMSGNEADIGNLPGKLPDKLKTTYKAILANNHVTNIELAAMPNQSERTIRNHTNELKKLKYIKRDGLNKARHWKIIENTTENK